MSRARTPARGPSRTALTLALSAGLVVGGATLAWGAASPSTSTSNGPAEAQLPGKPPALAPGSDGRTTGLTATSLSVTDGSGSVTTYALTSSTTFHQGPRTTLSRSALALGDHVVVRPTTDSARVAADVDVRLAHIDGTVTRVDGRHLTVIDPDGFTRQIISSSTLGTSVRTGSAVHAEGRVDADGTTLDASMVELRTAPEPGSPPARPRSVAPRSSSASTLPAPSLPAPSAPGSTAPAPSTPQAPAVDGS